MSDVERRQTRQRAVSIAAVAAAFAVGGPLVDYRFDAQHMEETYRIDAPGLNEAIRKAGLEHASADARLTSGHEPWRTNVVYGPAALRPASPEAAAGESFAGLLNASLASLGEAAAASSELDCLAEAVYYEARSESVRGQRAVAEVVMNRVRSPHYPKTICGVVYQGRLSTTGCQFTFTCDGSTRHAPRGDAWERARDVALHTMMGLSSPITHNATHYHTDYVDPYWSAGLIQTTVIGSHIFYRMPSNRTEWSTAQAALAADQARRSIVFSEPDVIEPTTPSLVSAAAPGAASAGQSGSAPTTASLAAASVSAF